MATGHTDKNVLEGHPPTFLYTAPRSKLAIMEAAPRPRRGRMNAVSCYEQKCGKCEALTTTMSVERRCRRPQSTESHELSSVFVDRRARILLCQKLHATPAERA